MSERVLTAVGCPLTFLHCDVHGLAAHSGAAPGRTGQTGQTTVRAAHTSSRIHSARWQTAGPTACHQTRILQGSSSPSLLHRRRRKEPRKYVADSPTAATLLHSATMCVAVEAHIPTQLFTKRR